MIISSLRIPLIPAVEHLLGLGAPYVRQRTSSDYWLYAKLFSSTCPVAIDNDDVVGVMIAFRSQDHPDDVYIQDVMTHPDHRRRGVTRSLMQTVHQQATTWGMRTSLPDLGTRNLAAHATWTSLGFDNVIGDLTENGLSMISNYKGPGNRAVYELKTS